MRNRNYRRILPVTLSLMLLVVCAVPCIAEDVTYDKYDWDTLNVANPTPLTGRFFTTLWNTSTSDLDVQELLHRYKLALYDYGKVNYVPNPQAVAGSMQVDDAEGNRTYYFSLYDNLKYSDGSQVTAWDYAFTILLEMDNAVREAGGTPKTYDWLLGAEEYRTGEADTLKGVRVTDDLHLAITAKKEALPYFYELSRFRFSPYPMRVIFPDAEIIDDGEGVYMTKRLSGAILEKTILDSYTGYMTAPAVVTGPYKLTAYKDGRAYMEINPYYKGDQYNNLPTIQKLVFGGETQEGMLDGFKEYKLDVLNKLVKEDTIEGILVLKTEENKHISVSAYPRTGLTTLRFSEYNDALQSEYVRKAVYYCLDRESISKEYLNGLGLPVNGVYGVGDWMLSMVSNEDDFPDFRKFGVNSLSSAKLYIEKMQEWQKKHMSYMTVYKLDVNSAIRALNIDGWNCDRFGDPYMEGVRYKKQKDGRLTALSFKVAVPENMKDVLEKYWVPNMEHAGMKVELITDEILDLACNYREITANYDMVFVGEDYSDGFDLEGGYTLSDNDPDNELALLFRETAEQYAEMNRTDKNDREGFVKKWMELQTFLADNVPMIPIYSNVYFDLYIPELRQYKVEDFWGWGNASVASYFSYKEPDREY